MLGSLFEPLIFLLVLGYGLGPVFQQAGQGDYFSFLTPGIIGQSILFNAMFSGMEIIWDRKFGFLKETFVAPISRFNTMLGRTLGSATVATIQGTLVMLVALLLGFRPSSPFSLIYAVWVMLLIAILFATLGTAIASMFSNIQGFQSVMNFIVLPIYLLSGALFPLQQTPGALGLFVRLDPLSYGVDALRTFFTNTGYFGLNIDIIVLGITTIIFLWLSGHFFNKIQI